MKINIFGEENGGNALTSIVEGEGDIIPIFSEEDEKSFSKTVVPQPLAILPLRNTVLFPGVVLPITVGREKSIRLVREIYKRNKMIGVLAQVDSNIEDPTPTDLFRIGTVAQIIKIFELPDGYISVIIQGKRRFEVQEFLSDDPYFEAQVKALDDARPSRNNKEFPAIVEAVKEVALNIIQMSANIPQEAAFAIKNIGSPSFLINFISSNSDLKLEEKQRLLEIGALKERAMALLELLNREVQMLQLKNDIQTKVKSELDQQQRQFMLHQQMKTIQNELGGDPVDKEMQSLKEKAQAKKWPEQIGEVFNRELEKLERLNPVSPEYSVQVNYLQVLIDLPWNEYTEDTFDLKHAQKVLDEDHYGLEKVKERILEYMAVLKLKGDLKSPILCLYGPPGVGKTSLGKSVARAIGRKYIRMSLGGLHDEAEIRGHRKTYIGAMPGRIIQNIRKVKSSNPVFILDEVDKVGSDFRGDPSSALLEVLDPEQNSSFYDNYLELEYDLSKVMFIATANSLAHIKPALLDRMELIEINGYLVEEKIEIARRHLIPKQLEAHGVKPQQFELEGPVLEKIIEHYTRESGVRELDKKIAKIIRVIARKISFGEPYQVKISHDDIKEYLGVPRFMRDSYEGNEQAGVVTGLAWTAEGGQILFVETSLSQGKESKLTLTGNLGEVMKESAVIAMEYLKAHAGTLGLDPEAFSHWNVHIHVPEGAIPKDGPSAGVTMITSLASAFTQRKVLPRLAMTGEITLRGKVLPVGGIKEKILAARRSKITDIILSAENRRDIEEIKPGYLEGLVFHYVETIGEVLNIALLPDQVQNPLRID